MPYVVTIEKITEELYGLGNLSGKDYKFPYVKIGDTVEFETFGRGKRRYHKQLNLPIYDDTLTGCKYYTRCGGCRARHIPYLEQFETKAGHVAEIFKQRFQTELKLVPAKSTEKYRHRMDFAVFPHAIGLRQEGNFRKIIDIESCNLQSDKANLELQLLRDIVGELSYDRKTEKGFLKYITIRLGSGEELTSILTFIESFKGSLEERVFQEKILQKSIADNLVFCYSRARAEVSAIGDSITLRGESFFSQEVNGVHLKIPFDSFFQPNPNGFQPILSFIFSVLEGLPIKNRMLDLFCGGGFFSLVFGEHFQEIYGLDIVKSSILEARKSCESKFPTKKIKFETFDLNREFDSELGHLFKDRSTCLFLDPPRNGLGVGLIKKILNSEISTIIYISCNPKSQIKDLEMLYEKFKISRGLITDPYPHTPHLESVILLERMYDP